MRQLQNALCRTLDAVLEGKRPRMPDAGAEILNAFMDLSRARTYHASGPNPITWEAMAAWSQMMRRPLPPHHAEIVMALDDTWMQHAARRMAGGGATVPLVSNTPLSAGLFDALTGV